MKKWMETLAIHHLNMRSKYPDRDLIIIFDIDDTIVDIRYSLIYVLQKYDRLNGTRYFDQITLSDIPNGYLTDHIEIDKALSNFGIEKLEKQNLIKFIDETLWTGYTIMTSHQPFQGVLEIMRWFQLQDRTTTGLNTGRKEELREVTIKSLKKLGEEFNVQFEHELLFMNKGLDYDENTIGRSKSDGIKYFENRGYKVIAMLDNEPANLKAIADTNNDSDILLLHVDTRFITHKNLIPKQSIAGVDYDLTDIANMNSIPKHISFVKNGVNSTKEFEKFIKSGIHWAELDVRKNPLNDGLMLRYDSFDTRPPTRDSYIKLNFMLKELKKYDYKVKLVLKEDEVLLYKVVDVIRKVDFPEKNIWFHLPVDKYSKPYIINLRSLFPKSKISIRADFLIPLNDFIPDQTKLIIDQLISWGINYFSISWKSVHKNRFFEMMNKEGYIYTIRDVYSQLEFLKSVLLNPKAITSNFNFPRWKYNNLKKETIISV